MGWSNWSGSVASPVATTRPQSEDELAHRVRTATKVRSTGPGHSFMPLCASDELILNLDALPGAITIAPDRETARIPAGWSIKRLTAALCDEGLALANQGDVNPQSLAGAMATSTHGTGVDLGNLSTMARGFRLIGADGEARWCDAGTDADLFQAQRLSRGMFGIATEIEAAVVPAFHRMVSACALTPRPTRASISSGANSPRALPGSAAPRSAKPRCWPTAASPAS